MASISSLIPALLDPSVLLDSLTFFQITFGAGLVGTWLSAILFGMSVVQTYNYFSEYSKDHVFLKALVSSLMLLNTVHMVLVFHAMYYYLISSVFDISALTKVIWSIGASVLFHIIIAFMVLSYFTKLCVQLVGNKNHKWILGAALLTPAIIHLAFGLESVVDLCVKIPRALASDQLFGSQTTQSNAFARFFSLTRTAAIPMSAFQAAADIMSSTALSILLTRHRTAFKRTNNIISTLVVYAVTRGILTSSVAMVETLAISIDKKYMWFLASEFTIAGVYVNSLLATLNARKGIREASSSSSSGRSLSRSNPSSRTPNGLVDGVKIEVLHLKPEQDRSSSDQKV